MPDTPFARLLILDDEAALMRLLHETLEAEGYSAVGFTSAAAALTALREESFDLILTDLTMPEMDGVTFLRAAFEIDPTLAGIVMTGNGTLATAVEAMQAGAFDYILKPFRLSAILPVLARSLSIRRVRAENLELHQAVGMYELTRAVGAALDFDTLLQKVADTALAQNRVRAVSVLLAGDKDNPGLQVAAARGENAADLQGRPGNVSVPMMANGNRVGVLDFTFDDPGRPIPHGQLKALNILASTAASALEAASLLAKVRAADKQYYRLTENAADIIVRFETEPYTDAEPRLAYINQAITAATGYTPEEFYADPTLALRIAHPNDRPLLRKILRGECPHGSTAGIRCTNRNGSLVWLEQRSMHVRDHEGRLVAIEAVARDVTERKQFEERIDRGTEELRRSLIEKTALLKEVHHRVKNNLQVICSLLSMQISCADPDSSRPLHDAHSRVLSMSLIHELIYQSDTLADLNFGTYIEALSAQLFGAYCVNPSLVHLELSVEPISLGLDQAIPCGLVLNELLSNSLKHAFKDGREGTIRVSLGQAADGLVSLTVADNGIGFPSDFRMENRQTLGLQVVTTLIRQLSADLTVSGEGGAKFQFTWRLPEPIHEAAHQHAMA